MQAYRCRGAARAGCPGQRPQHPQHGGPASAVVGGCGPFFWSAPSAAGRQPAPNGGVAANSEPGSCTIQRPQLLPYRRQGSCRRTQSGSGYARRLVSCRCTAGRAAARPGISAVGSQNGSRAFRPPFIEQAPLRAHRRFPPQRSAPHNSLQRAASSGDILAATCNLAARSRQCTQKTSTSGETTGVLSQ